MDCPKLLFVWRVGQVKREAGDRISSAFEFAVSSRSVVQDLIQEILIIDCHRKSKGGGKQCLKRIGRYFCGASNVTWEGKTDEE